MRPSEFVLQTDPSQKAHNAPRILLIGKLDNANIAVDDPVTGYIILKVSKDVIKYL